jgi:predicted RNase H-like HicB family nuclease
MSKTKPKKPYVLSYRTIIQKDGKYFHGWVPSLPGCHTQGTTIEETMKNLKEAMTGWLESTAEQGWPIPEDELVETIQTVTIDPDNPLFEIYA